MLPKKYRRIIPFPVWVDSIQSISQNPGVGPGWTSSFTTWADGTSDGHTNPKQTFGLNWPISGGPRSNALGFFQWNVNLFLSFYRGLSAILPQPNVALDRSIAETAKIELLDANGNVLTTASWLSHEHDTYPPQVSPGMQENFTTDQAITLVTEIIPDFNAVRASVTATPLYTYPSGPSSGYFQAMSCVCILYFLLQKPEEI
jgi:hypothetical protein